MSLNLGPTHRAQGSLPSVSCPCVADLCNTLLRAHRLFYLHCTGVLFSLFLLPSSFLGHFLVPPPFPLSWSPSSARALIFAIFLCFFLACGPSIYHDKKIPPHRKGFAPTHCNKMCKQCPFHCLHWDPVWQVPHPTQIHRSPECMWSSPHTRLELCPRRRSRMAISPCPMLA